MKDLYYVKQEKDRAKADAKAKADADAKTPKAITKTRTARNDAETTLLQKAAILESEGTPGAINAAKYYVHAKRKGKEVEFSKEFKDLQDYADDVLNKDSEIHYLKKAYNDTSYEPSPLAKESKTFEKQPSKQVAKSQSNQPKGPVNTSVPTANPQPKSQNAPTVPLSEQLTNSFKSKDKPQILPQANAPIAQPKQGIVQNNQGKVQTIAQPTQQLTNTTFGKNEVKFKPMTDDERIDLYLNNIGPISEAKRKIWVAEQKKLLKEQAKINEGKAREIFKIAEQWNKADDNYLRKLIDKDNELKKMPNDIAAHKYLVDTYGGVAGPKMSEMYSKSRTNWHGSYLYNIFRRAQDKALEDRRVAQTGSVVKLTDEEQYRARQAEKFKFDPKTLKNNVSKILPKALRDKGKKYLASAYVDKKVKEEIEPQLDDPYDDYAKRVRASKVLNDLVKFDGKNFNFAKPTDIAEARFQLEDVRTGAVDGIFAKMGNEYKQNLIQQTLDDHNLDHINNFFTSVFGGYQGKKWAEDKFAHASTNKALIELEGWVKKSGQNLDATSSNIKDIGDIANMNQTDAFGAGTIAHNAGRDMNVFGWYQNAKNIMFGSHTQMYSALKKLENPLEFVFGNGTSDIQAKLLAQQILHESGELDMLENPDYGKTPEEQQTMREKLDKVIKDNTKYVSTINNILDMATMFTPVGTWGQASALGEGISVGAKAGAKLINRIDDFAVDFIKYGKQIATQENEISMLGKALQRIPGVGTAKSIAGSIKSEVDDMAYFLKEAIDKSEDFARYNIGKPLNSLWQAARKKITPLEAHVEEIMAAIKPSLERTEAWVHRNKMFQDVYGMMPESAARATLTSFATQFFNRDVNGSKDAVDNAIAMGAMDLASNAFGRLLGGFLAPIASDIQKLGKNMGTKNAQLIADAGAHVLYQMAGAAVGLGKVAVTNPDAGWLEFTEEAISNTISATAATKGHYKNHGRRVISDLAALRSAYNYKVLHGGAENVSFGEHVTKLTGKEEMTARDLYDTQGILERNDLDSRDKKALKTVLEVAGDTPVKVVSFENTDIVPENMKDTVSVHVQGQGILINSDKTSDMTDADNTAAIINTILIHEVNHEMVDRAISTKPEIQAAFEQNLGMRIDRHFLEDEGAYAVADDPVLADMLNHMRQADEEGRPMGLDISEFYAQYMQKDSALRNHIEGLKDKRFKAEIEEFYKEHILSNIPKERRQEVMDDIAQVHAINKRTMADKDQISAFDDDDEEEVTKTGLGITVGGFDDNRNTLSDNLSFMPQKLQFTNMYDMKAHYLGQDRETIAQDVEQKLLRYGLEPEQAKKEAEDFSYKMNIAKKLPIVTIQNKNGSFISTKRNHSERLSNAKQIDSITYRAVYQERILKELNDDLAHHGYTKNALIADFAEGLMDPHMINERESDATGRIKKDGASIRAANATLLNRNFALVDGYFLTTSDGMKAIPVPKIGEQLQSLRDGLRSGDMATKKAAIKELTNAASGFDKYGFFRMLDVVHPELARIGITKDAEGKVVNSGLGSHINFNKFVSGKTDYIRTDLQLTPEQITQLNDFKAKYYGDEKPLWAEPEKLNAMVNSKAVPKGKIPALHDIATMMQNSLHGYYAWNYDSVGANRLGDGTMKHQGKYEPVLNTRAEYIQGTDHWESKLGIKGKDNAQYYEERGIVPNGENLDYYQGIMPPEILPLLTPDAAMYFQNSTADGGIYVNNKLMDSLVQFRDALPGDTNFMKLKGVDNDYINKAGWHRNKTKFFQDQTESGKTWGMIGGNSAFKAKYAREANQRILNTDYGKIVLTPENRIIKELCDTGAVEKWTQAIADKVNQGIMPDDIFIKRPLTGERGFTFIQEGHSPTKNKGFALGTAGSIQLAFGGSPAMKRVRQVHTDMHDRLADYHYADMEGLAVLENIAANFSDKKLHVTEDLDNIIVDSYGQIHPDDLYKAGRVMNQISTKLMQKFQNNDIPIALRSIVKPQELQVMLAKCVNGDGTLNPKEFAKFSAYYPDIAGKETSMIAKQKDYTLDALRKMQTQGFMVTMGMPQDVRDWVQEGLNKHYGSRMYPLKEARKKILEVYELIDADKDFTAWQLGYERAVKNVEDATDNLSNATDGYSQGKWKRKLDEAQAELDSIINSPEYGENAELLEVKKQYEAQLQENSKLISEAEASMQAEHDDFREQVMACINPVTGTIIPGARMKDGSVPIILGANEIKLLNKHQGENDVPIMPTTHTSDLRKATDKMRFIGQLPDEMNWYDVDVTPEQPAAPEVPPIQSYEGNVVPEDNVIFVFGSNMASFNGNPAKGTGGAALDALTQFGVEQTENMDNRFSKSGKAYGLTTVTKPGAKLSRTPEQITLNIKKLYAEARANPDKVFKVAYRNTDKPSLNGYTGFQMMDMFNATGEQIPSNVVFSKEWVDSGKLKTTSTIQLPERVIERRPHFKPANNKEFKRTANGKVLANINNMEGALTDVLANIDNAAKRANTIVIPNHTRNMPLINYCRDKGYKTEILIYDKFDEGSSYIPPTTTGRDWFHKNREQMDPIGVGSKVFGVLTPSAGVESMVPQTIIGVGDAGMMYTDNSFMTKYLGRDFDADKLGVMSHSPYFPPAEFDKYYNALLDLYKGIDSKNDGIEENPLAVIDAMQDKGFQKKMNDQTNKLMEHYDQDKGKGYTDEDGHSRTVRGVGRATFDSRPQSSRFAEAISEMGNSIGAAVGTRNTVADFEMFGDIEEGTEPAQNTLRDQSINGMSRMTAVANQQMNLSVDAYNHRNYRPEETIKATLAGLGARGVTEKKLAGTSAKLHSGEFITKKFEENQPDTIMYDEWNRKKRHTDPETLKESYTNMRGTLISANNYVHQAIKKQLNYKMQQEALGNKRNLEDYIGKAAKANGITEPYKIKGIYYDYDNLETTARRLMDWAFDGMSTAIYNTEVGNAKAMQDSKNNKALTNKLHFVSPDNMARVTYGPRDAAEQLARRANDKPDYGFTQPDKQGHNFQSIITGTIFNVMSKTFRKESGVDRWMNAEPEGATNDPNKIYLKQSHDKVEGYRNGEKLAEFYFKDFFGQDGRPNEQKIPKALRGQELWSVIQRDVAMPKHLTTELAGTLASNLGKYVSNLMKEKHGIDISPDIIAPRMLYGTYSVKKKNMKEAEQVEPKHTLPNTDFKYDPEIMAKKKAIPSREEVEPIHLGIMGLPEQFEKNGINPKILGKEIGVITDFNDHIKNTTDETVEMMYNKTGLLEDIYQKRREQPQVHAISMGSIASLRGRDGVSRADVMENFTKHINSSKTYDKPDGKKYSLAEIVDNPELYKEFHKNAIAPTINKLMGAKVQHRDEMIDALIDAYSPDSIARIETMTHRGKDTVKALKGLALAELGQHINALNQADKFQRMGNATDFSLIHSTMPCSIIDRTADVKKVYYGDQTVCENFIMKDGQLVQEQATRIMDLVDEGTLVASPIQMKSPLEVECIRPLESLRTSMDAAMQVLEHLDVENLDIDGFIKSGMEINVDIDTEGNIRDTRYRINGGELYDLTSEVITKQFTIGSDHRMAHTIKSMQAIKATGGALRIAAAKMQALMENAPSDTMQSIQEQMRTINHLADKMLEGDMEYLSNRSLTTSMTNNQISNKLGDMISSMHKAESDNIHAKQRLRSNIHEALGTRLPMNMMFDDSYSSAIDEVAKIAEHMAVSKEVHATDVGDYANYLNEGTAKGRAIDDMKAENYYREKAINILETAFRDNVNRYKGFAFTHRDGRNPLIENIVKKVHNVDSEHLRTSEGEELILSSMSSLFDNLHEPIDFTKIDEGRKKFESDLRYVRNDLERLGADVELFDKLLQDKSINTEDAVKQILPEGIQNEMKATSKAYRYANSYKYGVAEHVRNGWKYARKAAEQGYYDLAHKEYEKWYNYVAKETSQMTKLSGANLRAIAEKAFDTAVNSHKDVMKNGGTAYEIMHRLNVPGFHKKPHEFENVKEYNELADRARNWLSKSRDRFHKEVTNALKVHDWYGSLKRDEFAYIDAEGNLQSMPEELLMEGITPAMLCKTFDEITGRTDAEYSHSSKNIIRNINSSINRIMHIVDGEMVKKVHSYGETSQHAIDVASRAVGRGYKNNLLFNRNSEEFINVNEVKGKLLSVNHFGHEKAGTPVLVQVRKYQDGVPSGSHTDVVGDIVGYYNRRAEDESGKVSNIPTMVIYDPQTHQLHNMDLSQVETIVEGTYNSSTANQKFKQTKEAYQRHAQELLRGLCDDKLAATKVFTRKDEIGPVKHESQRGRAFVDIGSEFRGNGEIGEVATEALSALRQDLDNVKPGAVEKLMTTAYNMRVATTYGIAGDVLKLAGATGAFATGNFAVGAALAGKAGGSIFKKIVRNLVGNTLGVSAGISNRTVGSKTHIGTMLKSFITPFSTGAWLLSGNNTRKKGLSEVLPTQGADLIKNRLEAITSDKIADGVLSKEFKAKIKEVKAAQEQLKIIMDIYDTDLKYMDFDHVRTRVAEVLAEHGHKYDGITIESLGKNDWDFSVNGFHFNDIRNFKMSMTDMIMHFATAGGRFQKWEQNSSFNAKSTVEKLVSDMQSKSEAFDIMMDGQGLKTSNVVFHSLGKSLINKSVGNYERTPAQETLLGRNLSLYRNFGQERTLDGQTYHMRRRDMWNFMNEYMKADQDYLRMCEENGLQGLLIDNQLLYNPNQELLNRVPMMMLGSITNGLPKVLLASPIFQFINEMFWEEKKWLDGGMMQVISPNITHGQMIGSTAKTLLDIIAMAEKGENTRINGPKVGANFYERAVNQAISLPGDFAKSAFSLGVSQSDIAEVMGCMAIGVYNAYRNGGFGEMNRKRNKKSIDNNAFFLKFAKASTELLAITVPLLDKTTSVAWDTFDKIQDDEEKSRDKRRSRL